MCSLAHFDDSLCGCVSRSPPLSPLYSACCSTFASVASLFRHSLLLLLYSDLLLLLVALACRWLGGLAAVSLACSFPPRFLVWSCRSLSAVSSTAAMRCTSSSI